MNKNLFKILGITTALAATLYYFTGSAVDTPQADQSEPDLSQLPTPLQNVAGVEPTNTALGEFSKIERKDCFAQFNNNQTPELLLQQKNNYLIVFFRDLESKSYDRFQLETIGDIAGLGKNDAFAATSGADLQAYQNTYSEVLLADNYDQQTELSSDQRDVFDNLIKQKDYSALINAFNISAVDATRIRFGRPLLSEVISHNPNITVGDLQALLATGTEIHLHTIATAIKSASRETVIFLAENYQGDLAGVWQLNGISINLTMASAAVFRDDLFFYFMNKGVNAYVDNGYEYSMLFDVMPEPATEDQKKRALLYVEGALKQGARSLRLSSSERLKRWLPDEIQQNYRNVLTPVRETPAELMELGARLKAELDRFQAQIVTAQKLIEACQKQHNYNAKNYLEDLLEGKVDSATLSLATKNLLAREINELQQKEWQKANEAQQKNVPAAQLREQQEANLANKNLHNQLMDKQWDKALGMCNNQPRQDLRQYLCAQLLHSYVGEENADWTFIEKILPNINKLDASLLTPLVMHNKMDFLKKFAARGLPFDQSNYQQDPIAWALRMGNNTEAIAFLLENGAPLKYNFPGPDALDVGLAELDQFNAAMKREDGSPYFSTPVDIAMLIKAGAPVERSHIEKVLQLKSLNPEAYRALVAAVPDLAAY